MILFVFEGSVREPLLFNTIQKLFLPKETEPFVCTYNSNIYSLYAKLKQYDVFDDIQTSGNTVSILNEILESERAKNMYDGFSRRCAVEELCKRCGYAKRY